MKHIFLLELKKAIYNRKNWFVLALYMLLLVVFVLSNMNTFRQVREQELIHIEYLIRFNSITASQIDEALARDTGPWAVINLDRDYPGMSTYRALRIHEESVDRFASNLGVLLNAVYEDDRAAEVLAFHRLLYDLSRDIKSRYEWRDRPLWPDPFGPLSVSDMGGVVFEEWDEFNRVRLEFVRYIVENNLYYLYRNEMTGFNFVYQVLLRFMPFLLLLIAFLTVCDVFTRENETGSYKFLLLQPYSRPSIYLAKLISALGVALLQIFIPLLLFFFILGAINGFGSPNYPVLLHRESYATFTPVVNNLFFQERRGFLFYIHAFFGAMSTFTNHGFAYVLEGPFLGISHYGVIPLIEPFEAGHPLYALQDLLALSRSYTTAFVPSHCLSLIGMSDAILLTIPLYLMLLLLVVSVSALIGVISQNGTVSITVGALLGVMALLFPAPTRDVSLLGRLNPYLYTNPLNILNGLGSTTGLTGMVVLLGLSLSIILIGIRIFSQRDIRC